jgi:L-glyceraldehyde reductase
MHWPKSWVKQHPFTFFPEDKDGNPIAIDVPIAATWAAMEVLVATGKARSIGVSNFNQEKLEDLLKT